MNSPYTPTSLRAEKFFPGYNYQYRLAERLWALYINNGSKYVICHNGTIHQPKTKDGKRPRYLTMKNIQGHLGGFFNIGVFASNISAKFICFDIDRDDMALVEQVIAKLVELGFSRRYIYPSISGGKGYHVEIFVDEPVRNETLYKLYRAVVEGAGLDKHIVEFRPQKGLAVRMPLSKHYKTGRDCWYLDQKTLEPVEDQAFIFQIRRMPREEFCDIVARIKLKSNGIIKGRYRIADPDHLILEKREYQVPMVTEPHTRHDLMVKYATYLRGCGFEQGEIYKRLMEWVDIQQRDLMESSDKEIEDDARLIAEWAGSRPAKSKNTTVIREYGTVRFDEADLNYVLNGKTKSDRRILFRSVLSQKLFGKDHAAQRVIAESLGISEINVRKRLKVMEADGLIKVIAGVTGKKTGTDHFFATANSYLPGDEVADVLAAEDFAGTWWMGEQLKWKNLLWLYAAAMTKMLGGKLAKYVGRREAEEIAELVAHGRPVVTETWEIVERK